MNVIKKSVKKVMQISSNSSNRPKYEDPSNLVIAFNGRDYDCIKFFFFEQQNELINKVALRDATILYTQ